MKLYCIKVFFEDEFDLFNLLVIIKCFYFLMLLFILQLKIELRILFKGVNNIFMVQIFGYYKFFRMQRIYCRGEVRGGESFRVEGVVV